MSDHSSERHDADARPSREYLRATITATVTTASRLHIGTGEVVYRHGVLKKNNDKDSADTDGGRPSTDPSDYAEVRAVATDVDGAPMLPGSTLKGALRGWLERHRDELGRRLEEIGFVAGSKGPIAGSNFLDERLRRIFGYEERAETEQGVSEGRGGHVRFLDARFDASSEPKIPAGHEIPEGDIPDDHKGTWDKTSRTTVESHVAIDRWSGAARENRLWNIEVVPEGVAFRVELHAEDVDAVDLTLLRLALEAFGAKTPKHESFRTDLLAPSRIAIGANTADGYGRFTVSDIAVNGVERDAVVDRLRGANGDVAALDTGSASSGTWIENSSLVKPIDLSGTETAFECVLRNHGAASVSRSRLTLGITLEFEGAFTCLDSLAAPPGVPGEKAAKDGERVAKSLPTRRDERGRPFLPASAFRGVLRSRAERIVATWAGEQRGLGDDITVHQEADTQHLSDSGRLFGATGRRTPIALTDFRLAENVNPVVHDQHFIAVDRFTGGTKDGALFRAIGVWQPKLHGCMTVDLDVLAKTFRRGVEFNSDSDSKPESSADAISRRAVPLLLMTLRDLIEGDLRFGWGASRGWGKATAKVEVIDTGGGESGSLPAWSDDFKAVLGELSERDSKNDVVGKGVGSTHDETLTTWRTDIDHDVFFLGGRDLEMVTIADLLHRHGRTVVDHGLGWGAKASHYVDDIRKTYARGGRVVLVELELDLGPAPDFEVKSDVGIDPGSTHRVVVIDHHDDRAGENAPSSLRQVFEHLGLDDADWTREFELVAANDVGGPRSMRATGATLDEMRDIRRRDRAAQGVTEAEETAACDASDKRETRLDGRLTIVRLDHARTACVADELDEDLGGPGYRNLLIFSPQEANLYGEGRLVEALHERLGGWKGGVLPHQGFWGASSVSPDEVLRVVESELGNVAAPASFEWD